MQSLRKVREYTEVNDSDSVVQASTLQTSQQLLSKQSEQFLSVLMIILKQPKTELSQNFFIANAIFSVLGKVTTHWSLKWVSFNTQVIGKCENHASFRFLLLTNLLFR
jgi:hypothetical protein